MGRYKTVARVWRRTPHAFVPPALALAGWLAADSWAARAPGLGRLPYVLPWVALAGWLVVGMHPLARYAPAPRARMDDGEPPAAALLLRWPLGAAVLGLVTMAGYYLAVGALFGETWWTTESAGEVAARACVMALQGVAGGLLVWEIVVGGDARRARAGAVGAGGRARESR